MRKLALSAALFASMIVSVFAQEVGNDAQPGLRIDQEHAQWIDHVMRSIATVKPGMTRKELLHVFTGEGGLSTRAQQRYVYRHCRYIKVEVEFSPPDSSEQPSSDDKIVKISRPFLEYAIMD